MKTQSIKIEISANSISITFRSTDNVHLPTTSDLASSWAEFRELRAGKVFAFIAFAARFE
jgi:hypothetical protein